MKENAKLEKLAREFDLQTRLARASELATIGSRMDALRKAEKLLVTDGKLPTTADELDLLARIYVQQRRFQDADTCWREAIRVSGGEMHYREVLRTLRNYVGESKKSSTHQERYILLVGVVLIVLLIIILTSI